MSPPWLADTHLHRGFFLLNMSISYGPGKVTSWGRCPRSTPHFSSFFSPLPFRFLPFCSDFKVVDLLRSTLHNAAGWACEHTSDWGSPSWVHLTPPHFMLWASIKFLFFFLFFICARPEHQTSRVVALGAAQSHGMASFSPKITSSGKASAPLCHVEFPRRRI